MYLRYLSKKPKEMGIAVIGIGNLSVGGSGKTPLVTELASRYDNVAIVLRGYGRESKGLQVVKDKNSILCDVSVSGDEAMIYAHKLYHAIVIVSEDRQKGIIKAKEMGCDIVFLDDAYSKHDIKKLDLLINVKSQNEECLPSGPFREKLYKTKEVVILEEDIDFKRITVLNNKKDKMSLVTAIARPSRLDKYLPKVLKKHYFEDHHSFKKEELIKILKDDEVESLLVTYKDLVKIEDFNIPLSLLDMSVEVDNKILNLIDKYIKDNYAKKN
jgi:tetraacyldisaccharide 4'-kinase